MRGYQNRQRSTGKNLFYRFYSPNDRDFPTMLELFSRIPDFVRLDDGSHLTPIPTNEAVSSLSAILLDDDYYHFLHSGKQEIEGLSVVGASHLIPLKARAWLDLENRRQLGDRVDEKDIRKHKNDVMRLYQLLTPTSRIVVPQTIKRDMVEFLERMKKENSFNFKSLGLKHMSQDEAVDSLTKIYNIGS